MLNKKIQISFFIVICLLFPLSLFANHPKKNPVGIKNNPQLLSFADNDQVSLVLSNVDVNRILVKNDKILNINGPVGLYTAKTDGSGAALITLYSHLPFTLYLSTVNKHSLSLFVTPQSTVGKTVILKPTSASIQTKHWEENSAYQGVLTTLMTGMVNHKTPEGYAYADIPDGPSTDFYGIATLTPVAMFTGSHLMGIVSMIQNKTKNDITLKPSYFYHHAIRAVALSDQTVPPLGTGWVYVIVGGEKV